MKYIAYLRKSEEDKKRQIQSIPRQRSWCKKTALRRDIKIVKCFEDSRSGHHLGRSGFQEMMEYIENSKEPIGILTWKVSRLARNPIDEGVVKYAFMRKKINHIISRDREYREGESQIIMSVDFGQATQYSIELSKDVTEGMNQKIDKGFRPTKAPYGYCNDPYGLKGEKKIFPDKKYFKLIQRFLKAYSTGIYSVPELKQIMTYQWGILNKQNKPFSLSTLYLILQRRFYCGEYLWNGKVKKGKHKPMISVAEFEKIQKHLKRTQKVSQNKYQNYYSGFISCQHCLSAITGYSKVKNNRYKGETIYHYLKCVKKKGANCPQIQVNRSVMDSQISTTLKKLVVPTTSAKYVLQTVEMEEKKDQLDFTRQITELQKQYDALEDEINTLGRKLAKEVITDHLFAKLNAELEKEQGIISRKLEKYQANKMSVVKKLERLFKFAEKAPKKFKNGSFEEKKLILQTIGSNFILSNGKLAVDLRFPFYLIEKDRQESQAQNGRIEPEFIHSTTRQKQVSDDEVMEWSSLWEGLRTYFMENDVHIPEL